MVVVVVVARLQEQMISFFDRECEQPREVTDTR